MSHRDEDDRGEPGEPLDENPKQLVATDHPRVFYVTKMDRFHRGELQIAKKVAKRFQEYTVVISMGPYRDWDVAYRLRPKERRILLDFYSPRLPTNAMVVDMMEEINFKLPELEAEARAEALAKGPSTK